MHLTRIQKILIYYTAGYLVIGGSFDIFSLIPNMQGLMSVIRILNILALTILVLFSGKKINSNTISLVSVLFLYAILSGTIFSLNFGFIEALIEIILLYIFVNMYEKANNCFYLYKAFINIVLALASLSFILWILGPCLGYISPINSIALERGEKTIIFENYYYITFTVNEGNFFDLILSPNICIFREKAFAATIFLLALIGEMFVTQRRSTLAIIILYLALFSTLSTTSVLIGFWTFILFIFGKSGTRFSITKVLSIILFFIALGSIEFIIEDKIASHSGESRMSDLTNGIKAWRSRPLFGYGYQPSDIYDKYSTGYSNSISQILVSGGIYLATIYLFPILKSLIKSFRKKDIDKLCFIIAFIPIFAINRCAFITMVFYILILFYQNFTSYSYESEFKN